MINTQLGGNLHSTSVYNIKSTRTELLNETNSTGGGTWDTLSEILAPRTQVSVIFKNKNGHLRPDSEEGRMYEGGIRESTWLPLCS